MPALTNVQGLSWVQAQVRGLQPTKCVVLTTEACMRLLTELCPVKAGVVRQTEVWVDPRAGAGGPIHADAMK